MSKTYVVELKEKVSNKEGWIALFVVAVVVVFWKAILFFIIGVAVYGLGRYATSECRKFMTVKADRDLAICLRADQQNRQVLAGDPVGVYGQYDPYTMPMTGYRMNLDNYNDGLRGWK